MLKVVLYENVEEILNFNYVALAGGVKKIGGHLDGDIYILQIQRLTVAPFAIL